LKLAIAVDRGWMRLAVRLLVTGMGLAPLAPTVAHSLGIFGIGRDSATVIVCPPMPLALRLAANVLVQAELRGHKRALAKTAGARHAAFPPDRFKAILRGNQNLETRIE
jgi:hypothetical protein